MSQRGTVRRVFPGGNTPAGFHSFYDQIVSPRANRIFVIKGGPGVGKSSFMRRIGQDLLDRGYDVEFHQCSADTDSIDGIYVPALDVALIDGTAPHVVDPQNPGAVDEILHLGDHWDEEGMRRSREEILALNEEYRFRYQLAYHCLAAARRIHDEWEACHRRGLDAAGLNQLTDELMSAILPRRTGAPGRIRHLFASAITPDGPVNHLDSLFGGLKQRFIFSGPPGTGKATLVGKVVETAVNKGYRVEAFHCPLDPTRVEHAIIHDLQVGLLSSDWPHVVSPRPGDRVIETVVYLDSAATQRYRREIQEAQDAFHQAFARTVGHLRRAKELHDEMEHHYIPNMDFARVEERRQEVLARILRLEQESRAGAGG